MRSCRVSVSRVRAAKMTSYLPDVCLQRFTSTGRGNYQTRALFYHIAKTTNCLKALYYEPYFDPPCTNFVLIWAALLCTLLCPLLFAMSMQESIFNLALASCGWGALSILLNVWSKLSILQSIFRSCSECRMRRKRCEADLRWKVAIHSPWTLESIRRDGKKCRF